MTIGLLLMQHGYSGVGVIHVPGGTGLYHCCGVCIGVQFKKLQGFFFISENFRSFKSAIFIFWSTVGSRNHARQNCKGRTVCVVSILK